MTPLKFGQRLLMLVILSQWFSLALVDGAPQQSTPPSTQSTARQQQRRQEGGGLVEEFSFLIKDLKVSHQGGNTLNISVRFRYKRGITVSEYPDFRLIAKDIENFMTNYPNDTDYWEITNKKVTQLILNKYPAVVSITSEIEVAPNSTVPYTRSSITTRVRGGRRGKSEWGELRSSVF